MYSSTASFLITSVGTLICLFAGIADLSPLENFRHQLYRLIAEFVRLLNDGREYRPFLDAGESLILFVKANDLHLADLVGILDGIQDRGTVVAPESDHRGDVRDT